MCGTGSLLLLLLRLMVGAPPSLADVPPLDRGRPDFYGAVADRGPVTAAWSAEPGGGDITLTLTVRGAANATEVRKPDLKARLAGRFQVFDRPDPPADAGAVRFGWTLRPVPGGVAEVQGLPFAYYRPGFPEGRRMATAYAEPLTISVPAPAPVMVVPSLPAVPPAGVAVPGWVWLVPVGLVPPLVLGGTAGARRLFPDAARRAELRRVKAVREVLDALAVADDPGATAATVRAYLRARPPVVAGAFAELLDRCDAARFGPPGGDVTTLPGEATILVQKAEASGGRKPPVTSGVQLLSPANRGLTPPARQNAS